MSERHTSHSPSFFTRISGGIGLPVDPFPALQNYRAAVFVTFESQEHIPTSEESMLSSYAGLSNYLSARVVSSNESKDASQAMKYMDVPTAPNVGR